MHITCPRFDQISDVSAQFGFDGDDKWKGRRDALFSSLKSNPLAPFVTRSVQFGSEPLFDSVLPIKSMIDQVNAAKKELKPLGIPVTVSELAYGYQKTPGSQALLDTLDLVLVHMLPFFSTDATTGMRVSDPLAPSCLTAQQARTRGTTCRMT
jgi:exo-beta-1,3-glucanase (GH17 family)